MGCSCKGLRGFGEESAALPTSPASFDPALLGQLVQSDAAGRISWRPEVAALIAQKAGAMWIAQDYIGDWPMGGGTERVVIARAQIDRPESGPASWGTAVEPVKADFYLEKMAQMGYNACASYGWAVPASNLEAYLIHIPTGKPESLRNISTVAPILSALPADLQAPLPVPGGGGSTEPAKSGWDGLTTGTKVAILGGGGLALAALAGMFGPKWKL